MKISRHQWLFAGKVYASAMLAYFVAASMGLTNPYWAMVTCCVLNNPLSGAMRARSLYRFSGTLLAGMLALGLSAWLASEPMILVLVTGLVSSVVMALAFTDRTPRAYSLQLAGITLMLVLVAYIGQPENMFNLVVTRLTEIGIGILAVSIVDAFFKPGTIKPGLTARLDGWIHDLEIWRDDCFSGQANHTTDVDRIRILNDVSSLSQLIAVLKYDHELEPASYQAIIALQRKAMRIIPRIAAIGHALHSLSPDIRDQLSGTVEQVIRLDSTAKAPPVVIPDIVRDQASEWELLVLNQLIALLNKYVEDWALLMEYRAAVHGSSSSITTRYAISKAKAFPLPPDTGLALRMFVGIMLTYFILSAIWYATSWSQGPNMVLLGVVAIGFFGGADEPGLAITHFSRFAFISTLTAFILAYGLLPLANSYHSFLLVMAAFMLPMGLWAATNPLALLVLVLSLSNVNFQNHYTPFNIGYFLDASVATLIGVYVAFLAVAMCRSWGAQNVLKQLAGREMRDQAKLQTQFHDAAIDRYVVRSLDRIALQASRLGSRLEQQSLVMIAHMNGAVFAARLRQWFYSDHGVQTSSLNSLLQALARNDYHYSESSELSAQSSDLLAQIDHCLRQACDQAQHNVQYLLTGLRIALFPQAPQFITTDHKFISTDRKWTAQHAE